MSFPKYRDSKPAQGDWFNVLPAHWEHRRLKELVQLVTEKRSDGRTRVGLENIESWTGRYQDTSTEFEGQGVEFRSGDLLFGKLRPYLAKIWLAEFNGEAVGDFHVMRPAKGCLGRFLLFQTLNAPFISIVDGSTFGAKMPRASWEFMGKLRLPVPPLAEQQTIAAFLDRETAKIDRLVAEQRRLIELLKEKRQAVISHAVTKGLNPDVRMKPSGIEWIGDVPEHWEVGKCGFYTKILSGFPFPSSNFSSNEEHVRLLRGVNVGVGEIKWDDTVFWERASDDNLDLFELSEGDLVVGLDRPLISTGVRVAKISDKDVPSLLLQRVASISADSRLDTDFLWHLLASDMFVSHFSPETTGVSVPHISPRQISSFVIPIPNRLEQAQIATAISTFVRDSNNLRAEAERAITLLQERRTALISAAVTGKIDVRGWNGDGESDA